MESSTAALQLLLEKIDLISGRYRSAPAFNVFTVLRDAHDEVHLHSAFLGTLLNPRGSHGLGAAFLGAFLQQCGLNGYDLSHASVELEQRHHPYGQIDLLIRLPGSRPSLVIIENKIYAADQPLQLQRYRDYALTQVRSPEQVHLFYLTLRRDKPSESSQGNVPSDGFRRLSYAQDIRAWLTTCIQLAALHPGLRETLVQYDQLLVHLTGSFMSTPASTAILDLLTEGRNAVLARRVVEVWEELKLKSTLAFWEELSARLQGLKDRFPGYCELPLQPCTRERLGTYYKGKGDKPYFGVTASLGYLSGSEHRDQLCLCINIEDYKQRLGLRIIRDAALSGMCKASGYDALVAHLQSTAGFASGTRNDWWLGSVALPGGHFSFRWFNDDRTLALANKEQRKSAVENLAQEVEKLLESCQLGGILAS